MSSLRKKFSKAVLPLAIIALAVAAFLGLRATKPEVAGKPVVERSWPVEVATVSPGTKRPRMRFEGDVVAGREADLRPLVAGTIIAVHPEFRDGNLLKAGETVIRIDPFTYEAALRERQAELAEARGRVKEVEAELAAERGNLERDREQWALARQDLERRRQLRKAGTVSERSLEEARIVESERNQRVMVRQQAIARFTARLAQAQAAVERLEWALRRAERNLADTSLKTPFDGFLYETDAAVGKQVGTNDRLGRLIAADSLEVRFHVPDAVYARLLEAPLHAFPAEVRWRVGAREHVFPAVLDRVDSRINAASGGVAVFARLPELTADTPLRPGAFVSVVVADQPRRDLARIPTRAIHDGGTVYVVEDGRLAARSVETVAREGQDAFVRGALADGDRVVLTRFPEIAPGLKVDVP